MIERLEDYIFEEKDDLRTRFNFVDSSTESEEIRITTMLVPDCRVDKSELERELEEMVKELEAEERNPEKRMTNEDFWLLWLDLVDLWGQYRGVKELYNNATSENTEFLVRNVVDKYYEGRSSKIKKYRDELLAQVNVLIEELNQDLSARRFTEVDKCWLREHIGNSGQSESVRGRIKTKLKGLKDPVDLVNLIEKKNNPD
jgi:hypothetical protein